MSRAWKSSALRCASVSASYAACVSARHCVAALGAHLLVDRRLQPVEHLQQPQPLGLVVAIESLDQRPQIVDGGLGTEVDARELVVALALHAAVRLVLGHP